MIVRARRIRMPMARGEEGVSRFGRIAMKKVEHVGTVVEVGEGTALIELKDEPGCGLRCACSCSLRSGSRTVRVARGDLEQGDTVRLFVPAWAGYLSIVIVFVLPIALFVAGGMVGAAFESGSGAHGTPTIVGAVAGFGLSILAAVLVNRWLTRVGSPEVQRLTRG